MEIMGSLKKISVNDIYPFEVLKELGLVDTGHKFADLFIYSRNSERYLIKDLGENEAKIHLKY